MFGGAGGLEDRLRKELVRREHFAALLPMPAPVTLSGEQIIDSMRAVVAHSGAAVTPHPLMRRGATDPPPRRGLSRFLAPRRPAVAEGPNVFLVVADVALWISLREGRIGHHGDLARFVNEDTWHEGGEALASHTAYAEICDLGMMTRTAGAALDAAFNRAVAVTAAAAAVARLAPPLALLWHPARSALPPSSFRAQFSRALGGHAPLELWMRWHLLQGEGGQAPGVATRGLVPFIGREVEVRPSGRRDGDALALAFAAASLLIDHRGSFADGSVVNLLPGAPAQVRVGDSRIRRTLPVYEFAFVERPGRLKSG